MSIGMSNSYRDTEVVVNVSGISRYCNYDRIRKC